MADTKLDNLIINELTREQYEEITPGANQLYLITNELALDQSDIVQTIEASSSTLTVPSAKATYDAIQAATVIDEYLKTATLSQDGSTLTLTKKDGSTVQFIKAPIVEANPTDTASLNLTKVKIGSTAYNLPSAIVNYTVDYINISTTWTDNGDGTFKQPVSLSQYTITDNTKVDLQPPPAVIQNMQSNYCYALQIQNIDCQLYLFAVGNKLTQAFNNVQVTCIEVI